MTGVAKPRVLALVPPASRSTVERLLAPVVDQVIFISCVSELSALEKDWQFHVALLPAALPDTDWWLLWRDLLLVSPRPAILIYAQSADFRLWSGVLELGGYDVILEPFHEQVLQNAVLQAFASIKNYES
jgi:PleD family two-component response regulator